MDTSNSIVCPLCKDPVSRLVFRYHLDAEKQVIERIKAHNPGWTSNDGACSRCVDYYHTEIVMQQRMLPEVGPYFPVKSPDDFIILPTGLRLDADPRFTGKGITICFIDSGFYLHPDIHAFRDRVKAVIDITDDTNGREYFMHPHPESWHGTMTTVVCAGDGICSSGLYKGIACDAELVLLKVQDAQGGIRSEAIEKALQWICDHHRAYDIKLVNISLGSDETIPWRNSALCRLAELLIENGVTIIAAAGNDENRRVTAPANSPHVITVGGLNDDNLLEPGMATIYHSSYGRTDDGLMKPELIAHAIWIAAPILPGTAEKKEAEILHRLLRADANSLLCEIPLLQQEIKTDRSVFSSKDVTFIREKLVQRIQETKFISPDTMHVDGTSFAAPIVTAVAAQLLEANPALTPAMISRVLFSTAKRLNNTPVERQGFGRIQPRPSIIQVLKRKSMLHYLSPCINSQQGTIEFYVQNDCAQQVSLSGSFNNWARDVLLMDPGSDGLWKIEIPMLPPGRYSYKYFVDDKMWMEDVGNPYREPDGFNGFNSILLIAEKND